MKLMLGIVATLLVPSALLFAQQTAIGASQPDRDKAREQAIERAKTVLGEKLHVAPSHFTLESAKEATWPNSALGCPEPDHMYAQVISEGWAVVLKADDTTHEVHISGRRAVVCGPKAELKSPSERAGGPGA